MVSSTLIILLVAAVVSKGQVIEDCRLDAFPPAEDSKLSTVVVNLDDPPEIRWKSAIEPVKEEIISLISTVTSYFNTFEMKVLDVGFDYLLKTLPEPYRSEIKGVADVLGISEGEVTLYNVFYELFSVCTSVVAEDSNGQLYHARNLDFGLFLGWDFKNETWLMSERLRKVVFNVDYQRNGKTVYQSASFLGYVGLLTVVKPPYFTLTINERFNSEGGFIGVWRWIMGDRSGKWAGFMVRDIAEQAESYSQAREMLMTQKLLAPAYYILGGNSTGEGVIITRSLDEAVDVQELNITAGRWYLLETNYDPWTDPPFYDDRRTPGNKCMKQWGHKTVGVKSLFNVMSTKPNLNKLTVYTSIMSVRDGITTWRQTCKDPCTPW